MKILCLIESLGSGGAERQLTGLAAMLNKANYDVKVITYFPKDFYRAVLDDAGVEYQCIPEAQSRIKRIAIFAKIIKKYEHNTVIAYSPSVAMIACVLKRIGFNFNLIVSERNTTQVNSLNERIKFYCYRWANWIVPNSHMQGQFILSHYPHLASKTRIITNFVDTDYFSPDSSKEDETPLDICRFICVGRDNPQKNQLRFFEAVKVLVDRGLKIHIDWYGSFESPYGLQCRELIRELHLEDTVSLKGETRNVRDEYRCHDVFCLPSIYEGYPNVLCEAMSCGLPVLCSRVCDNPLIVTDEVNGLLFNPKSVSDIVEKMESFLKKDRNEWALMGRTNRIKAETLFSPKSFIDHYKTLL